MSTAASVPFADLFSVCPDENVNAAHRVDPFWYGLWVSGSQISWISRRMAELRQSAGMGRLPYEDRRLEAKRGRSIFLANHRNRRLASLAAVGMWRTVSTEQIAAIVGSPHPRYTAGDMRTGFAASVVERGTFGTSMLGGTRQGHMSLFRPLEGDEFDLLAEQITYEEWIAVTAGHPWRAGNQYDRHNMLATEFGLRVAEFCNVASVVGESLSSFGLLAPEKSVPPMSAHRAADLTLVRPDGMRIAVEITANTGSDFRKKVAKWVELLRDMDPDEDNLCVVFVEAASPNRQRDLYRSMTSDVINAVYGTAGAVLNRVPERIAVASWKDWFPEPHAASASFLPLRCARPTGALAHRWEEVSLLDPDEQVFRPKDPTLALAALNNLNLLWGVPHWLRGDSTPLDLVDAAVSRSGLRRAATQNPRRVRQPQGAGV